jgi:hypothetical protein
MFHETIIFGTNSVVETIESYFELGIDNMINILGRARIRIIFRGTTKKGFAIW